MSLLDLKSLVSTEDFADAHEPLNDGVKEVPNAQTVAASVKTGDVGKDTTSQGPAKIIPEKPDTDDETKTEHTVVKESAEKSGKDSGDGDESSSESDESENKDDEADEGTPLEHDNAESAKTELEKTEKAKEALEAYAPKAKRFDIIGHPTRQAERIGKALGFVQRRSGNKGTVTVSAESIDAGIALSQNRIAQLEREVRILSKRKVSNEDIDESVIADSPSMAEEIAVTEAPTEHAAPPMDAAAAAALTEAELDPLDVPLLEIKQVQDTLDTLQAGQSALEQYREIIRANPRMSKQAAAVLHAGLEHIDMVCGLKARSTGLESYVTTPRAAMEEADVGEKTLLDRAGEIGAKILKWIKMLVEKATQAWHKYQMGLDSLKEKMVELKKSKFKTDGEIVLRPAPPELFIEGNFSGDWLTPEEERLPGKLDKHYTDLTREITRRCRALLNGKRFEDIELVMEALKKDDGLFCKLPGPRYIGSEAGRLHLVDGDAEQPDEYKVDLSDASPGLLLENMIKSLDKLSSMDTVNQLKKASDEVIQGLIKYRKGPGKDIDEATFQKLQQTMVDNSVKLFDVDAYFEILKYIGKIYTARYKLCAQMVSNA